MNISQLRPNNRHMAKAMRLATGALLCIVSLCFLPHSSNSQEPPIDPANFISVEFNNAPLAEIIALISEYTKESFVISAPEEIFLSWAEPDIHKDQLLPRFKNVITGAGMTINTVPGKKDLYIIRKKGAVIANAPNTLGSYRLKNINLAALKDTAATLYADSLSINTLEGSSVVLYSGSPELVMQFTELLQKIDLPKDTDIEQIRLKHISVKSAIKALTDTKLIADNAFYPDYWNRSVIIKGTPYERNVALATFKAIDKPQKGWVDQLEFIHTIDQESAISLLSSACENVEVRKVAKDRLLISGTEKEVDRAATLLRNIDGTGLQVKVEAVIAYLTDREFKELGTRIGYQDKRGTYAINKNLLDSLISRNTGILLDYFNDFLGITLAAEEGKGHGEILSSPVLTVLNGQEARIHVGQSVPFLGQANINQNTGTQTGTSIERKDVGLTFTVKPSIQPNGEFVQLTVSQEVSHVTGDSELSQNAVDIIVDKKEIKSTVVVADGDTIFLGGLRSEEKGSARDAIPLLGDLPLVGKLFTYDVEQNENRHLIVSLRVNVIGKES